MPKVQEVIQYLLPRGSRGGRWEQCPLLPADAFAVAATLVDQSSCYTRINGNELWTVREWKRRESDLRREGRSWAKSGVPPPRAQAYWDQLVQTDAEVGDDRPNVAPAWWKAAIDLLALADEASLDAGFTVKRGNKMSHFYVVERMNAFREGRPAPSSLCRMVPTDRLCVQPKTRTAQVGATLRSLSHHLALLPPDGVVQVKWYTGAWPYEAEPTVFNVLVVPFPYHIAGSAFFPVATPGGRYFDCHQGWLPENPDALVDFLKQLVTAASQNEGAKIHAIILPELALSEALARSAAQALLGGDGDLEWFLSGMKLSRADKWGRNYAYGALRVPGTDPREWRQAKHHRWKLDSGQIERYRLGHALNAARAPWWEAIELSGREVNVAEFRPGAVMAVMICEDLARVDPVQTVLRSMGPNLVVALLMDGPQLKDRWSARYATVLAEDPGSSVLTVSSLGMLRRSGGPGDAARREIALWREPGGQAQELVLPKGSHALLLSLTMAYNQEEHTMDGRSDGSDAITVKLSSYTDVKVVKPPEWVSEV